MLDVVPEVPYIVIFKKFGVPVMVQWKRSQLGTMRLQVQSLASLSGLRIRCCHELWFRLQMQLRSAGIWLWRRPAAVALIRPLAWEPPCAVGWDPKKIKKPKKKNESREQHLPRTPSWWSAHP